MKPAPASASPASSASSTAASSGASAAAPSVPEGVSASTAAAGKAARQLLRELEGQFPVFRDALPLAIGIDKQLLARRPEIERKILRIALRLHTQSVRYLKGVEKAATRFDLDGQPGDALDDAHRAHAAERLRERFRQNAAQQKARREAEAAEQRRNDKLQQLAAKFSRR